MTKFLLSLLLPFFFLACGDGDPKTPLFEIELEGGKKKFNQNQSITVSIKNVKEKSIEKVTYSIDGRDLPVHSNQITLKSEKLGNRVLTAKITHENGTAEITKNILVLSENAPVVYTYEILNTYPHDDLAYTQGLEFHNDTLYESTGHKGTSWLRKLDFKTGNVLNQIDLDDTYFGEGITIMNDKIFQLTWKGRTGFIYDLKEFKKIDSFQYGESFEGWGLCNDGEKIYKSDGTAKIWLLNPDTLIEEDYIETVTNTSIFNKANELEYIDGKIYANVYQKESMMIIDSKSGAIEGVINFGGLKSKVTQHDKLDVLNGVAYHPQRKTFFVTGKNWDKLFEVKISKK